MNIAELRSPRTITNVSRKVLAMVSDGRSNKEIAEALRTTEQTIKNRLRLIYAFLGIQCEGHGSRVIAARWWLEVGQHIKNPAKELNAGN